MLSTLYFGLTLLGNAEVLTTSSETSDVCIGTLFCIKLPCCPSIASVVCLKGLTKSGNSEPGLKLSLYNSRKIL